MIVELNASPYARQMDEYLAGLGPLRELVEDDSLTEIMVKGPDAIYVERAGRVELTDLRFGDHHALLETIQVIVTAVGRRVNSREPLCDARLLDGSRVAISMAPVALNGPLVTIRKFSRDPFRVADLVRFGTLTEEAAAILEACVLARCNMIISGATGTGKTTMLNVCSSFIPAHERIVTIEDAAELRLNQPHVCTLEAQPADLSGDGQIPIRELVKHSLRMRPDRIIVGECRGGEALDMLQAMNTGHDGSLSTIHANSPRDCIARMETLVLMAGMDLPVRAIRQQIASAVDVIVQLGRMRDGSRRLTAISEVVGMEGEVVTMQDLYTIQIEGADETGRVITRLTPTGVRPRLLDRLTEGGIPLPRALASAFPARRDAGLRPGPRRL
jgi:pilus assembly protein CpaF